MDGNISDYSRLRPGDNQGKEPEPDLSFPVILMGQGSGVCRDFSFTPATRHSNPGGIEYFAETL